MLGALEARRREDPLVVIGVHSAKFDAERDPSRILSAMGRHGVRHPVVVDEGRRIWTSYAVRSWPTLVVVRPDGTIAAVAPGEADLRPLDEFVGRLLAEAREAGTLARAPLALAQAAGRPAPGPLAFPGKVAALPAGGLAVSDTGHHRVVVMDEDGAVRLLCGSGEPGLVDGPLVDARFHSPQGLSADEERLYVADTGNHAVREVDLRRGVVRTIAGTGELGRGMPRAPLPAREVPLRSPWDVAVAGDYVLVAMAGIHQIWAIDRRAGTASVLAGSGREAIDDGPFAAASFAQPSGLALAGSRLYVADSETSAVRYLDLARGEVRTLVGEGLFEFGDRDGPRAEARLQHPLAVAYGPRGLLVADTYNGKVRRVDEETGEVRTVFPRDGGERLDEPGGLCQLADGRVVVADTNRHRVVVLEGHALRELRPHGSPEARPAGPVPRPPAPPAARPTMLGAVALARGTATLRITLSPPDGLQLTPGSTATVEARAPEPTRVSPHRTEVAALDAPPVATLMVESARPFLLDLEVHATVCGHGEATACWPVEARFRLPVAASAEGPEAALVTLTMPDPR